MEDCHRVGAMHKSWTCTTRTANAAVSLTANAAFSSAAVATTAATTTAGTARLLRVECNSVECNIPRPHTRRRVRNQ